MRASSATSSEVMKSSTSTGAAKAIPAPKVCAKSVSAPQATLPEIASTPTGARTNECSSALSSRWWPLTARKPSRKKTS